MKNTYMMNYQTLILIDYYERGTKTAIHMVKGGW